MSTKMDAINIELVEKHYKDWIKDNPGWPYDSSTMIHFGEFCLHKELEKYHELEEASNGAWWDQVNIILLVNFLRMPEDRQKRLFQSIVERKPNLIKDYLI